MKLISRICWLFVGGLFIFSGLIKINDPVGTAIKLEEYFEVFATDFSPLFLVAGAVCPVLFYYFECAGNYIGRGLAAALAFEGRYW